MLQRILRVILRVILIPLLLLGLGFGAQKLAELAFRQSLEYPGPVLGSLDPGRPTAATSQRVVVIVVDGLREDTSRQMPAFQHLRERGADLPSWASLPAISCPGYTTLGTGTYPEFSTVTTNWYDQPVPVDSLFARVQEAGRRTALVSMDGWNTLFGPWTDVVFTTAWGKLDKDPEAMARATEALGAETRRVLQEEDVALLYVHFGEPDVTGHAYGGTSSAYIEAALQVDAQIAAIADVLDWSQDTLILTADHGMTAGRRGAGGGHGGNEPESRHIPLVMVGRGIAPGVYPDGGQADVAPTVATLLGIPIPAHNQGHSRLDALVLTPEQRADKALALGEQQQTLYTAYLDGLDAARAQVDGLEEARASFAAGEYHQVEGLVDAFLDRLDLAVARAVANRLWRERALRLPYILLPLLAGALYVGLYHQKRELAWPALWMLLFFVLSQVTYWLVRGYTLSFSSIGGMGEREFFLPQTVDAIIALAVVAVVAGVVYRRRPWEEVVWTSNQSTLFIGWAMLCQLGLYVWLYGLIATWRLPHLGWGFKFYLDLLAAIGIGYAGLVFPWLALGVSRLFKLADWLGDAWRRWRERRALSRQAETTPRRLLLIDRLRDWWGRRREQRILSPQEGATPRQRFPLVDRLRDWWGRRQQR